ncbi:uncharacterized protein [Arachis hypogaea]|uniref:uncharacterized protein isoform X2 n=1 Tax=Arachis hypogaea TaxID=3818 RepID=UPI003B220AF8
MFCAELLVFFLRFSKTALIVEFVWASTFAGYASFLMTMYLRNNTIAAAVEFAELEDLKIASTATSVEKILKQPQWYNLHEISTLMLVPQHIAFNRITSYNVTILMLH